MAFAAGRRYRFAGKRLVVAQTRGGCCAQGHSGLLPGHIDGQFLQIVPVLYDSFGEKESGHQVVQRTGGAEQDDEVFAVDLNR